MCNNILFPPIVVSGFITYTGPLPLQSHKLQREVTEASLAVIATPPSLGPVTQLNPPFIFAL